MKELFKNADADFCSLVDYVKSFTEVKGEDHNLFQLPPIQRNAVWNVAQIERLWDSILRGFPIGSFLVSPRQKNDKARDLNFGVQTVSTKEGLFLLDGQQRTRGILLGFKPNEDARIWIDLNPNLIFDNVEQNDRKFLLRVITNYQPWGMNDRNPSDKLTESQKGVARQELEINNLHYDYDVEIDNGIKDKKGSKYSWPVRAKLPVPLDTLIELCGGTSGKFTYPSWKEICKLIPERYHAMDDEIEEPAHKCNLILEAIKHIIDTTSNTIRNSSIVLLYQNQIKIDESINEQDDMEVLFRRINAGGTVLQGEEMAYSLLKSSWDGAYEMVSLIVKNKSIGYLLPSTGIVIAAARLARFIQNKNDTPNPGVGDFRKWIGDKENENGSSFLEVMRTLLQTNREGKSLFHQTMESFCELVLFREQIEGDIGLPKKLLLSIKSTLYLPIFVWIYRNKSNKEILETNRLNVLRYLISCFLTVNKYDKASKIALKVLKENESTSFPDKQIYQKLLEEELTVYIPNPVEFAKPFALKVDGFFRHWQDLFEVKDDDSNTFRQLFWEDSGELLLWFQRAYASKWFKDYDPTSNDAYDTPYDLDHIMPYSHLISRLPNTYSNDKDLNNKFEYNRHLYVNSIGNLRIWPFWANRSDGNNCHSYKLRMQVNNWDDDLTAKELYLCTTEDFLSASVINAIDQKLWYNAGGKVRDWPEDRRIAWQQAIENRACYLYEQLYSTFDFKEWD